jgi:hypothetical protein
MTCNVGGVERAIRMVLGMIFLGLAVSSELSLWGSGFFYVLGVVSLVTGAVGFCPVWKVLGISTCPMPGVKR